MAEPVYPVPANWSENALVNADRYQAMYAQSVADPDTFWAREGQRLDWIKP